MLVVGTAVASGFTLLQRAQYQSTTELFVALQNASNAQDLSSGTTFTQQVVKSYAEVATSPIVLDRVAREVPGSPADLAPMVSAEAPLNTVTIDITVTDTSPTRAAALANSVGKNLAAVVQDLNPSSDQSNASVRVTTIRPAAIPNSPVSPRVALNLTFGVLGGLIGGVVLAAIVDRVDTRVRGRSEIELAISAPVIGELNFSSTARERPVFVNEPGQSAPAEAYRALRSSLGFLSVASTSKTYLVTSSIPGEGKSTTVANLAVVMAEAGRNVLLLEGDLRRPRVADYLGIDGTLGLSDVLAGSVSLQNAVQRWGESDLFILPAGTIPPNPSELLQSEQFKSVLTGLQSKYDEIIIDAPPLLPVTDASLLAEIVGGAVLVAAAGRVSISAIRESARVLERVGVEINGVVLTMLKVGRRGGYGYGYGYGYEYSSRTDAAMSNS